jgi:putative ABC transport system substrate-binding protein
VECQPARSQPYWIAVFDELRRAGFIEGQTLIVDWHPYSSHVELIPAFAAKLAQSKPDVIVGVGDAAIRAAPNVTKTILILSSTDDVVASGLGRLA